MGETVVRGDPSAAARSAAVSPAARATTPSQRARRQAVLAAAIQLAREGGYDAVQMREVAERAGVALGTLYRYFPSKVHLLATALGDQLEARDRTVAKRRRPADPGDRVLLMFDLLLHDLKADRLLSEALVRAMMFADASVSAEVVRVREITNRMITEAVHGRGHAVDDRDAIVAGIIGKVFMTDLLGWLGDQMTIEDLRDSLVGTVRVALAGRDAARS